MHACAVNNHCNNDSRDEADAGSGQFSGNILAREIAKHLKITHTHILVKIGSFPSSVGFKCVKVCLVCGDLCSVEEFKCSRLFTPHITRFKSHKYSNWHMVWGVYRAFCILPMQSALVN